MNTIEGDKILERAEREASDLLPPLPPPATPPPGLSDDRRSRDGVGPSGRLVPKGDSEEPGEIIKILKAKKLAPEDMEHWGSGMMGDGKIYLNDDGEACKIAKLARLTSGACHTRSAVTEGVFYLHVDPSTSILQRNGRRWVRQKRKLRTRRTSGTKLV